MIILFHEYDSLLEKLVEKLLVGLVTIAEPWPRKTAGKENWVVRTKIGQQYCFPGKLKIFPQSLAAVDTNLFCLYLFFYFIPGFFCSLNIDSERFHEFGKQAKLICFNPHLKHVLVYSVYFTCVRTTLGK